MINDILTDNAKDDTLGIQNVQTVYTAKSSYNSVFSQIPMVESAIEVATARNDYDETLRALDEVIHWLNGVSSALMICLMCFGNTRFGKLF